MNEKAKKRLKSAGAVTLAVTLLLTGTFAWSNSLSLVTNQAYGATNPGGRLHDDFDGTNKDIYVENFGTQNIYARVKLTEYMEIGSESYNNVDSTERNATSVVSTATLNDKTTWTNYFKKSDSSDKDKIAEYFEWTTNGGKTVYMPTFNKNKDSYVSDVNGRYVNEVGGAFSYTDYKDGSHYTDYNVYKVGDEKEAFEIVDADDDTTDELSEYMVTTAINSADSEALKTNLGAYLTEGHVDANTKTVDDQANTVTYEKVKHVAAETIEASAPITMETYNGYGADAKAAYVGWIIDEEDGWAYWSQKIEPGTATGLLLDSIGELKKSDGENWYYAIDAEAQFITVDDEWNGGDAASAPSDAAKTALGAMGLTKYKDADSQTAPTVNENSSEGTTTLKDNGNGTYTATIKPADGKEIDTVKVNDSKVSPNENNEITVNAGDKIEVTYKDKTTTPSQESTKVTAAKAAIKAAAVVTSATTDLTASTVSIDGVDYIVIAKDASSATLLQKNIITNMAFDADSNVWKGSDVQKYLNSTEEGDYLADKPTLAEMAKTTKLYTAASYDRSGSCIETNDKVYLLSEADVFGTANASTVTDNKEYTNGSSKMDLPSAVLNTGSWWFLRSPRFSSYYVAVVGNDGTAGSGDYGVNLNDGGVRPALTVNL